MELGLAGKRALVTGASRGIGYACAWSLAAEGCDLAMAARHMGRLREAVKSIRTDFRVAVTSHATDLADPARQAALVEMVGDVDILVNNAGAIPAGSIDEIDDQEWRHAWDLKVFGYINLSRMILRSMYERGSGVIINVVGTAAVRPRPDYAVGASGNAALVGFTRSVGQQAARYGVRVVAVNPGLTMTDRLESTLRRSAERRFGNPERWDELLPTSPGAGQPAQVADVVTFLASHRASHINATAVTVDGGASGV